MSIIAYIFMCLFIGIYVYYQGTGGTIPSGLETARVWISWAILALCAYQAGNIIVNCLILSSKGQMTPENFRNGILIALMQIFPVVLMSVFVLRRGFA